MLKERVPPGEGEEAMSGPWRDRRFDPAVWRTPVVRVEAGLDAGVSGGHDHVTGMVIAYITSVVTSVVFMLVLLKAGW